MSTKAVLWMILFLKFVNCEFLNRYEAIDLYLEDEPAFKNSEYIIEYAENKITPYLGMQACKLEKQKIKCVVKGKIGFMSENGDDYLCKSQNINENSVFNIASVSKMFTVATLLRLIEDKPVLFPSKLDTKLSFYFSHLKKAYSTFKFVNDLPKRSNYGMITLRHLVQHTSGLSDYFFGDTLLYNGTRMINENEFLLNELLNENAKFGEFSYSNIGYNLLGMIMKSITNLNYSELVKKYVIKPLNLKQTFTIDDLHNVNGKIEFKTVRNAKLNIARSYSYYKGNLYTNENFKWDTAMAGLYSSVSDLVLFINEFFKNDNSNVLFNENSRRLRDSHVITIKDSDNAQYGIGFFIYPNGLKGHGGSDMALNALLAYDSNKNISVGFVITGENLTSSLADVIIKYQSKQSLPDNFKNEEFLSNRLKIIKHLRRYYSAKNLIRMNHYADVTPDLFYKFYEFSIWKNANVDC